MSLGEEMSSTKLAKRLSYLICTKLCKKMYTSDYSECNTCEIQRLINKLAFPEKYKG